MKKFLFAVILTLVMSLSFNYGSDRVTKPSVIKQASTATVTSDEQDYPGV